MAAKMSPVPRSSFSVALTPFSWRRGTSVPSPSVWMGLWLWQEWCCTTCGLSPKRWTACFFGDAHSWKPVAVLWGSPCHTKGPPMGALVNSPDFPADSQHQPPDEWIKIPLDDSRPSYWVIPSLQVFPAEAPDIMKQWKTIPTVSCLSSWPTESLNVIKS